MLANTVVGQNAINKYKFVVVPAKFSFLADQDQYQLNTLTKLFLEKYGFIANLDFTLQSGEMRQDHCEVMYADVISSGSFIRTKLQVVLMDCKGNILYHSCIGTSKAKEYKLSYTQALRAAFQSFDTLNYRYTPEEKGDTSTKATVNHSSVETDKNVEKVENSFFAEPIVNGFQLVDAKKNPVMKVFKTSVSGTFSAVKGAIQGVLVAKDNQWFFEYYENEKLVSEKVNIQF